MNYNLRELTGSLGVDVDNVEASAGSMPPVPAGDYLVEVTGVEVRSPDINSNPWFTVEFTIRGTADGEESEFSGRRAWQSYWLRQKTAKSTEIALSRLKNLVGAAGAIFDPESFDTDILLGAYMYVEVYKQKGERANKNDPTAPPEKVEYTNVRGERAYEGAVEAAEAVEETKPAPAPAKAAPAAKPATNGKKTK